MLTSLKNNRKKQFQENDMPATNSNDIAPKEVLDKGQRISADWLGSAIKKDLPQIIRRSKSVDEPQPKEEKEADKNLEE